MFMFAFSNLFSIWCIKCLGLGLVG